jgi:hypothetical protein
LGNYWEKSLIWKRDWGFICWGKKEVICESWWLVKRKSGKEKIFLRCVWRFPRNGEIKI